jgi:hypothetical protein
VRRASLIAIVAAAAWSIAFVGWRTTPASFDFIALYASARLVATGHPSELGDRDAILAIEHETRPERTRFLNNPNPPAVSALLAPLGLLPYENAYAVMLTALVATLVATSFVLAPLVRREERAWLFPIAMLAPSSLIALIQGQTTPLILLAVAASLRARPGLSGLLLATTALRPQFLPLFALVALADRERRLPFLGGLLLIAVTSFALLGFAGIPGYIDLLTSSAAELRPGDLGIASLVRRLVGGEDALLSIALSGIALTAGAIAILRTPPERRTALATSWSLFAAPHALPHDGVLAYPAIATAARTAVATRVWAISGVAVSAIHQAGIPIASLWLLALSIWTSRR